MDDLNPPAIVQSVDQAVAFFNEAMAYSDAAIVDLERACFDVRKRGELLLKAKEIVGHGNWLAFVRQHAKKGESYATIKRYMAQAKSLKLSDLTAHTHLQLPDKPGEEDSDEEDKPPLTDKQRKVLMRLIESAEPALGKKLLGGKKKMTDAELEAACPPSCDKCRQHGPPPGKPCEWCKKLRDEAEEQSLFATQEPANPDDPTSPPKPPPDPYAGVAKMATTLTLKITKLAGDDPKVCAALTACGLIDHKDGIRFRPLAGVRRVIELLEEGETNLAKIKYEYDKSSGAFAPNEYWSKKKGRR